MAKAVRMYQIMFAAQGGLKPEEVEPPMDAEERKLFDSTKEECDERRAKGLPQFMYELPWDAFDDEDGIEDIYPDDFDEKVMAELEEEKNS